MGEAGRGGGKMEAVVVVVLLYWKVGLCCWKEKVQYVDLPQSSTLAHIRLTLSPSPQLHPIVPTLIHTTSVQHFSPSTFSDSVHRASRSIHSRSLSSPLEAPVCRLSRSPFALEKRYTMSSDKADPKLQEIPFRQDKVSQHTHLPTTDMGGLSSERRCGLTVHIPRICAPPACDALLLLSTHA